MPNHEPRVCLLLHGFTGGPFELEPLADYLRQQGYVCVLPTLPGHDAEMRMMRGVQWQDWLNAVAVEADRLSRQYGAIDVVGFSMGGLLSAYVANRFPVRRLVLLNAAVIYVSPGKFIRNLAQRVRIGLREPWERPKSVSLSAPVQFMKLVRYAKQQELPRISVPTLVVQGKQDQVIHPYSARYIYDRLRGEKELLYMPHSRHMICLEPEAPQLFAAVAGFLDSSNEQHRGV
ncbi:alpha/beta hydrolase [Paenibacillus elgii]|uniref:alpha/beta hydrolase n=1 Tax=Paenibacillus elgii TaxID=189691 RepID=UPI001EF83550|nr:alpha/beta fold hydrolase [Paenibacillus elgii]